ncbi:MAG TPA: TetR/AcrR family transcriptional regulator [Acidimicrobiales bacterium]|nr:TetR/AcrR family transcriptional regulator [Acidimicrobiales bacterium]
MAREASGLGRENAGQRILDASVRLFATRGYAATGIRPIADAAGVTTAALYYYAQTKNDLLMNVMRTGLSELLGSAQRAVAALDDPVDQIRALIDVHVRFGASDPDRAKVIDNEVQWLEGERRISIMTLRDEYEALWASVIARGNMLRSFQVQSESLARLALLEMCNGLAHWYRPDGPMTLEEIVAVFEDMAFSLLRVRDTNPASPVTNDP